MQLSARLGDKNQEHCVVYNMMRLADYLLRWTGDAAYADYWERNLYNGILAQQHPETGMVAYFLPLRSGSVKHWGTPTDDFWCCHGTLVQAQTMVPDHIFYEEGDDLVLAQYIPCQFDGVRNGSRVGVALSENAQLESSRRPASRAYTLEIACDQPQEFDLVFRLPGWLSGRPEVTVNGEPQALSAAPSAFARIHKVWQHDTVQIALPRRLAVSPLPDLPSTVAFMEGPVVLAGVLGDGSPRTGDKTLEDGAPRRGVETLREKTLYGTARTPPRS